MDSVFIQDYSFFEMWCLVVWSVAVMVSVQCASSVLYPEVEGFIETTEVCGITSQNVFNIHYRENMYFSFVLHDTAE